MIRTTPGFLSEETGIVLIQRTDGALEPFMSADNVLEWLKENKIVAPAFALQRDILLAFAEFADAKNRFEEQSSDD